MRASCEGSSATACDTWWYSASSWPISASPSATASNTVALVVARQLLRERRDRERRLAPDLARVGRDLAGDDPQQRRLARAVAPDQAHALAGLDLQATPRRAARCGRRRSRRDRGSGAASGREHRAKRRDAQPPWARRKSDLDSSPSRGRLRVQCRRSQRPPGAMPGPPCSRPRSGSSPRAACTT